MPGGLLNLVSYGSQNVILNGNPSKTFFKCSYAKYTNFGLQKFRVDFDGQKALRLNQNSVFEFKFPRYADLLMDTYLVVTLPTIWSPIHYGGADDEFSLCNPYEFKWIDNLGTQLIKEVSFTVGGQLIQKFSGQYLYNMVQRDFTSDKKRLYNAMTGHTIELNDPETFNEGIYPNAVYNEADGIAGAEPSIRSRKIFIPINIWFTLMHKMAFPLVSLQYNELHMELTLRPIVELFVIRDVLDTSNYIKANQNISEYGFYRFIQQPLLPGEEYIDKRTNWNADIHLMSTYCFLSDDEVRVFAAQPQKYMIKEVFEYRFDNQIGSGRVELDSLGLVSNWMWYFQRSDADLRNEWSNYTNWPYNEKPFFPTIDASLCYQQIGVTGPFKVENQKDILLEWGILLNGDYRENLMDAGVYNYIEKYVRTLSYAKEGLYCYNFCLNSDPFTCQPSGGINMSKFKTIEFEYVTYLPPMDENAQTFIVCDPSTDDDLPVAINKPVWRLYDYNYNLVVFEERYNILVFQSGNAALMYVR
jgi:hypothetical protein